MNHFQHVVLSMSLVLISYLVFQNQQLRAEIQVLTTLQQGSSTVLAETLAPLAIKIDAINAVTSKQGKAADEAEKKQQALAKQRSELSNILATLKQANQLRTDGKGKEAAEKLASAKKPIWQAGDTLTAQKTRLQALMGPIDKFMAAWKSGDTSTAPDAVSKEIEAVLGELGHE
ncbi:hypothetical protein J9253_09505 [Thiothrix litoralis]|jgi:hypothetical protein|uniref:Uncharacterized protein n=1 Tax=Thiothrix litoralis TaxID=2891210 RepID=A0ABX7WWW5_9GAMM|nr:hypothetical protein [Thiothrix litoralis]QTR48125.1 hypothetical protein J9253_09505 [Thiothrix litoralis]